MNYHEMNNEGKVNYRKSGMMLSCIVFVSYIMLLINGRHYPILMLGSIILAVLAMLEAWPLRKIIDSLTVFGDIISKLTNPLILGLVYVVAIVPTSFFLKLTGKDVLQLRYNKNMSSYWINNSECRSVKSSFRKQF